MELAQRWDSLVKQLVTHAEPTSSGDNEAVDPLFRQSIEEALSRHGQVSLIHVLGGPESKAWQAQVAAGAVQDWLYAAFLGKNHQGIWKDVGLEHVVIKPGGQPGKHKLHIKGAAE
eukprot:9348294-Pyramimonas_sp.AAC.1